ncbi:MAG: radical SAM protein [Archangiaceae bacterium]|nr:radical SAM protein [Archangiaceae bacterium]
MGWTLRLNLLEQCQYRCGYCRPQALRAATPNSAWLTPAEYARLGVLFHAAGVEKVRLTGGEPLLRDDVEEIVRALKRGCPSFTVALTTNGQRLGARLEGLARAGLDRATVHVDSLRAERYRALMGDGDVAEVLAGLEAAHALLGRAKLNVVVQRGGNEDELLDFLAYSRVTGVEVRFIELMNTGSARDYVREAFVPGAEILERAGAVARVPRRSPSDPAALYRTADGLVFGLIASDTQPFCAHCNRLRLMPDGRLAGCLYQGAAAPLGAALRAGATDAELAAIVAAAVRGKRSFHPSTERRAAFSMSEAGG